MIILSIETSCDETAISVIDGSGDFKQGFDITVLGDKTLSQIELHKEYGGVYPNMAKRAHANNLIPVLKQVMAETAVSNPKSEYRNPKQISNEKINKLKEILNREPELLEQFLEFIPALEKPQTRPVRSREGSQRDFASNGIDAIAVTEGPGLEPCLWTGINLAKALSLVWDIPVIPVNHMEGHIVSAMLRRKEISNDQFPISKQIQNTKPETSNQEPISYQLKAISYPSLSLLISGGHTELVLIRNQFDYEIIGQTRDDAVGEAFDKVARLLGLPYPGGPEISRLAEKARSESPLEKGAALGGCNIPPVEDDSAPFSKGELRIELPRPMLHSGDFDFSFSGIKTSVLYLLKKLPELTLEIKKEIALEFENAVTEVLIAKTKKAIEHYGAQAMLLGGGVVANTHIRREFERLAAEQNVPIHIPEKNLTTDNALMIAVAGLLRFSLKNTSTEAQNTLLKARGNLKLDEA